MRLYLIAYAPSSPQRVLDLARLAFHIDEVEAFVVVKPTSMAAQVGIPEIGKLAYKMSKKFIVLPQLQDLKEVVKIDEILFIVHDENVPSIDEINLNNRSSIGIVVQAGDIPFTKNDLSLGTPARIDLLVKAPPIPVADAVLAMYKILKKG